MTALCLILFFVVMLIHMGISTSIEGLFGTLQEAHPEYKDEFAQGKAMFLNTRPKQKHIIEICRAIDSYDSRRLASLIQIDNMVLVCGVFVIGIFGITDFIIN